MKRDNSLSKHVVEFLLVAREFVAFSETAEAFEKNKYIDTCSKLFSMLYLKALFLPEVDESEKNDSYGIEFVNAVQYERVKSTIEQHLGDADAIIPFKDSALMNSQDSVNTSLSELLADVYQDIANFVEAYRIGEPKLMNEALETCTLNFRVFWGARLIAVIDQLHRYRFLENNNE